MGQTLQLNLGQLTRLASVIDDLHARHEIVDETAVRWRQAVDYYLDWARTYEDYTYPRSHIDFDKSALPQIVATLSQAAARDRYQEAGDFVAALNAAINPPLPFFDENSGTVRFARRFAVAAPSVFPILSPEQARAYSKLVEAIFVREKESPVLENFGTHISCLPQSLRLDLVVNFLRENGLEVKRYMSRKVDTRRVAEIVESVTPHLHPHDLGRLTQYFFTVHEGMRGSYEYRCAQVIIGRLLTDILPRLSKPDLQKTIEWLENELSQRHGDADGTYAAQTPIHQALFVAALLADEATREQIWAKLYVSRANGWKKEVRHELFLPFVARYDRFDPEARRWALDRIQEVMKENVSDHIETFNLLAQSDLIDRKDLVPLAGALLGTHYLSAPFLHELIQNGLLTEDTLRERLKKLNLSDQHIDFWARIADDKESFHALGFWDGLKILYLHLRKLTDFLISLGDSATPAELVSLLCRIGLLEFEEVNLLMQDYKHLVKEGVEATGALLGYTLTCLGLDHRDDFMAVIRTIDQRESRQRLVAWQIAGLPKVWAKYDTALAKVAPEGREALRKKLAKKMKNFLEAQLAQPTPSFVASLSHRAQQIIEEQFVEKLKKSAGDPHVVEDFLKTSAWSVFKTSRLYGLCLKASRFMKPQGLASMSKLILGLNVDSQSRKITYPRDSELEGVLTADVLVRWADDYRVELAKGDPSKTSPQSLKAALYIQARAQIRDDLTECCPVKGKIPASIAGLPALVSQWLEQDPSENSNVWLLSFFERYYNPIRQFYGDGFANIRTNLRNLMHGLEKSVITAQKSEAFVVSGDIEIMARSGSEPVLTCQTFERRWVNDEGQPIHRLLHGQFKVANWAVDERVVARRLVEITVDPQTGREHLLVDRLYTAGGFVRADDFASQILAYAKSLGIESSRVHFNGDDEAPAPLATGDLIYRDSFKEGALSLADIRRLRSKGFQTSKRKEVSGDVITLPHQPASRSTHTYTTSPAMSAHGLSATPAPSVRPLMISSALRQPGLTSPFLFKSAGVFAGRVEFNAIAPGRVMGMWR